MTGSSASPRGGAAASRTIAARRLLLQQQLSAPLPAEPELVLVTDLDGTLLGGTIAWRQRFYAWLERRRDRVLHVFCTGRDLSSIARLLEQDERMGLRAPHLVIGDVGCTVACGASLEPVPLAVDPIERRWIGLPERLAPMLENQPGISSQPLSTDRRLAFFYDPDALDHQLLSRLEAEGVDCLLSDGRYLDLLPAGVNKGSTLLDLLGWLEVDTERVVTAGDSLNDLAMFQTGLRSIMVGNAEPALQRHLPSLPHTYAARAEGCEGIAEGLAHFGFGHLFA